MFWSMLMMVVSVFAAEDPLWSGLPEELSPRFPEEKAFVGFDPIPNHHAPFLNGPMKIDGHGKSFSVFDVFSEEFFALLPPRTRILVSKNAEGLEVWDYPPGTKVLHRIFLNTQPRTIFELRILMKRQRGDWAYGLYYPTSDGARLSLHRTSKLPVTLGANIVAPDQSGPVTVTGNRVHPQSCAACHFSFSPAQHQYPSREQAGPCGFVSPNPSVLEKWAPTFERVHGYWPFRVVKSAI